MILLDDQGLMIETSKPNSETPSTCWRLPLFLRLRRSSAMGTNFHQVHEQILAAKTLQGGKACCCFAPKLLQNTKAAMPKKINGSMYDRSSDQDRKIHRYIHSWAFGVHQFHAFESDTFIQSHYLCLVCRLADEFSYRPLGSI